MFLTRQLATSQQRRLSSAARWFKRKRSRFFSSEGVEVTSSRNGSPRFLPDDGFTLQDFVSGRAREQIQSTTCREPRKQNVGSVLTFHLKTYGCQMNVNDSDIVRSLLFDHGFQESPDENQADILLSNTCAIREGAEEKVWHRMRELRGRFKRKKVVGVLGCMAERLKDRLFEKGLADLVVGPDAYRDLPRLLYDLTSIDSEIETALNVQLSLDETYADITPVRHNPDSVSAFVSIQRGCANRCSFCIVPFTRGQERSRPFQSIVDEVTFLHEECSVKEVTLLGQNVNSYHDQSPQAIAAMPNNDYRMSNEGFRSRIRRGGAGYYFADLVQAVSDISSELRVRFTSPHPKDYPPELLSLMAERPNVCNSLHMPAQSGSSSVLKRMSRGYTREAYLKLMEDVHSWIPDVAISSDFIAGFCDETEEEHRDTLTLMEQVRYDQAFMFAYSLREKTHAHRVMADNVSEETKQRRLREIINTFRYHVQKKNEEKEVGRLRLVMLEGESKRSRSGDHSWSGRTDQNKRIIFPTDGALCTSVSEETLFSVLQLMRDDSSAPFHLELASAKRIELKPGDYAVVEVTEAKGHALRGRLLSRSSIRGFEDTGLSKLDETSLRYGRLVSELFATADDDKRTQKTGLA